MPVTFIWKYKVRGKKITASHLKLTAYLYIRQSTVRQVFALIEKTDTPILRLIDTPVSKDFYSHPTQIEIREEANKLKTPPEDNKGFD